jgi:centromere-localized protein 2
MAPTEAELLANYLIQPSTLTAITTLDQFKALFPRPLQSSPQVRSLFRDLQAQRADVLDQVAENIADEAKRSLSMRREVLRAKREAEREDIDAEIEMERAVGSSTIYDLIRILTVTSLTAFWRCIRSSKCQAHP